MALGRDERCGARSRRGEPKREAHLPETADLGLTGLGEALLAALRQDERFRDVLDDPFGEHGPAPAA